MDATDQNEHTWRIGACEPRLPDEAVGRRGWDAEGDHVEPLQVKPGVARGDFEDLHASSVFFDHGGQVEDPERRKLPTLFAETRQVVDFGINNCDLHDPSPQVGIPVVMTDKQSRCPSEWVIAAPLLRKESSLPRFSTHREGKAVRPAALPQVRELPTEVH